MDEWGRRALVCALVVVGCLVAVGLGVATADTGTVRNGEVATGAVQENGSAAANLSKEDEIHVTIDIYENRSAAVEVDYRYELNVSNDSTVDWEGLRTDVDSNPDAYIEPVNERWQDTVEQAHNETGREMNLSEVTVTTTKSDAPVEIGHVQFRFEWSSFATGEPGYLEAGDALAGFALVDHSQLRITWPGSYNATDIEPEPSMSEDDWAHWDGSVEFGDGQPRIELIENGTDGGTDEEDELGWGIPWQTGVVVAIALLSIVGIAGWMLRRESIGDRIAGGADPTGSASSTGDAPEIPPPELLSNEEQVLRLLERRGGRLKQQQVVSELEWTEAKTSQVVTGLREDGEIEVFRIGRENVLVLADED